MRIGQLLWTIIPLAIACSGDKPSADWDEGGSAGGGAPTDPFGNPGEETEDIPEESPYTGGWPYDSCRDNLESTGMAEGDVILDVTLLDQYGEDIRLHDFCNHTILIEHAGFA